MPAHPLHALVTTLRRRPGVQAAVVVSPDGLAITEAAADEVAVDRLAAQAPLVWGALAEHATLVGRGALGLTVLDLEDGGVLLCPMSDDAILVVVTDAACDRPDLLADLRRFRPHLARLA